VGAFRILAAFLIIWAGNLPQEISRAHRLQPVHRPPSSFFILPSIRTAAVAKIKREAGLIVKVAIGILFVRLLDLSG
jgi:hypothetical protein